MQMWVKDATANKFLKLLERMGRRGVPELQVSDIPDVHADCAFPHVKYLGPPTIEDGIMELGRKISYWDALWGGGAATGRAGPQKLWNSLPLEEAAAVRELCHLSERLQYQVENLGIILRSPS